jgi:hypothetical protein
MGKYFTRSMASITGVVIASLLISIKVACHKVVFLDLSEVGDDMVTRLKASVTSWMEPATPWRLDETRNGSSDHHQGVSLLIDRRDGLEQAVGVRVFWSGKEVPHRRSLYDLPCIHHTDAIAQLGDDP